MSYGGHFVVLTRDEALDLAMDLTIPQKRIQLPAFRSRLAAWQEFLRGDRELSPTAERAQRSEE